MSSPNSVILKEDIKHLEKLFLKKNSNCVNPLCFRIITASIDELSCEFLDLDKNKYRINANITVIIQIKIFFAFKFLNLFL